MAGLMRSSREQLKKKSTDFAWEMTRKYGRWIVLPVVNFLAMGKVGGLILQNDKLVVPDMIAGLGFLTLMESVPLIAVGLRQRDEKHKARIKSVQLDASAQLGQIVQQKDGELLQLQLQTKAALEEISRNAQIKIAVERGRTKEIMARSTLAVQHTATRLADVVFQDELGKVGLTAADNSEQEEE